ncbi:Multi-pass transmembrane protein, related [Eimeria praecox]|uniref:Multi-pass transmembrane protein, related n=1 Tax=Eimeria praecox TaxID=51316 RepID=U6HA89_9EIME|nr:Multi-pass transmembrane protein, related [Eimeria praecox]
MPVLLLLPLAWALSSGSTVSAACCYPQHTELIKRRLGSLEDRGNCQKVSEEVLCVMCEPRFGTGELESKGKPILCPQLCEKWFNACKEEFVSASPSGSGSALTFCEESSLICSRLSATLEDSLSFCRQMGFHVPEDDDEGLPEGAVQGRRSCFNGIPTASFGSAPKRSDSDQRYRRSRDTQDDWEGWLRGIGFAVYEVLSRPEVWLLLLVLGFLLNQLVQQARDIMQTHMQEEKLRRRQQILQRYGVEEEEEEVESVADADEKDSAALSGEAEGEKGRAEPLRSSSQHSRPARERS